MLMKTIGEKGELILSIPQNQESESFQKNCYIVLKDKL